MRSWRSGIRCTSAWVRSSSRPARRTGCWKSWMPPAGSSREHFRREGMDRNIGLEAVRLTEAAAMASARVMGRGDEKLADQVAVDAMRKAVNQLNIRGTVVIGEGERDEAPMLYIGEKGGKGDAADPEVDIALDPLEGTTITATGGANALSVIAMSDKG